MNKKLLFLSILLSPFIALAQIEITKQVLPAVGVSNTLSYLTQNIESYNFDADASAGYTWDISGVTPSPNPQSVFYTNTSSTSFADQFKNAPIAVSVNNSTGYTFLETKNATLYSHGHIDRSTSDGNVNENVVPYKTPLALYQYPLNLNDSQSSSTTYEYTEKIKFDVGTFEKDIFGKITRTVKAEGYGKIKFFDGQELDILRLKIEEVSRDSVIKSGVSAIVNKSTLAYEFWSNNYASPVLKITIVDGKIYAVTWMDLSKSTFLKSDIPTMPSLSSYPNPSTGLVSFASVNELNSISVLDMCGRLVFQSAMLNEKSIDLSVLDNGYYHINLFNKKGEKIANSKIAIQH